MPSQSITEFLSQNSALILMCASGARSSRAAAQLRKAGHEKAFSLAGGIGAWREAGFPVDKSA